MSASCFDEFKTAAVAVVNGANHVHYPYVCIVSGFPFIAVRSPIFRQELLSFYRFIRWTKQKAKMSQVVSYVVDRMENRFRSGKAATHRRVRSSWRQTGQRQRRVPPSRRVVNNRCVIAERLSTRAVRGQTERGRLTEAQL